MADDKTGKSIIKDGKPGGVGMDKPGMGVPGMGIPSDKSDSKQIHKAGKSGSHAAKTAEKSHISKSNKEGANIKPGEDKAGMSVPGSTSETA